MKTLVIHPTDYTTRFLTLIHKDKDWTVITEDATKKFLKKQIKNHDRIVMLGHGTELGLLGYGKYIIDSSFIYLLSEKECVCIWCNADVFVEKYGLKGFYTGMIISEIDEAYYCGVRVEEDVLLDSNWLFAEAIQYSIDKPDMLEKAHSIYIGDSHVVEFNKSNMYYE